jgi:hypothetical protein
MFTDDPNAGAAAGAQTGEPNPAAPADPNAPPAPPADTQPTSDPPPAAAAKPPKAKAPAAPAAATMNTVAPDATDLSLVGRQRYGLYYFAKLGYCATPHGPFMAEAVAKALVDAGLCEFEPSGGAAGSIKITDAGRAVLAQQAQAAAQQAKAG